MSKLKIVIADNESIIRMDLKEMLEEAGHEVVGECFNGLKAIELTQRFSDYGSKNARNGWDYSCKENF